MLEKIKDKSSCVNLLSVDNKLISNDKDIAKQFAKFFSKVGENQADYIGTSNTSAQDFFHDINQKNSIYRSPTDECEIINIINGLLPKTSCGHDKISNKI